MTRLGVSAYPELRPLDEIGDYLARAASCGFTRVFSSMFSMPGSPSEVLGVFASLNEVAHRHGMEVSLDINPACMQRLGATPSKLDVFANIGVDILRMDGAYSEVENLRMLKNPFGLRIEYNASALHPKSIESLVAHGAPRDRILACHNFYPQRYTGYRWDKFCQVNERLAKTGVRIGAFLSSHTPNSHGVWDATCGLPTVERLRDYPAHLQARVLAAAGTTDVLFGNAYATEAEMEEVRMALAPVEPHYVSEEHRGVVGEFSSYAGFDLDLLSQKKVLVRPIDDLTPTETAILFDFFPHVDMGDSSEWIWRSRMPRQFFGDETIAARPHAADYFEPGDVVVVNDNYKHYAGEVQVVLMPIVNDGTRNLVGHIDGDEMTMFDVIADGDVVVFQKCG